MSAADTVAYVRLEKLVFHGEDVLLAAKEPKEECTEGDGEDGWSFCKLCKPLRAGLVKFMTMSAEARSRNGA